MGKRLYGAAGNESVWATLKKHIAKAKPRMEIFFINQRNNFIKVPGAYYQKVKEKFGTLRIIRRFTKIS